MDIEAKVWSICDILRADGMHIGTYIEQLTVLLFLKMLDEQQAMGSGVPLPEGCDWQTLKSKQGLDLLNYYAYTLLPKLAEQSGVIGDIFARVNNQFREPVNLRRAIDELDEVNWSALEADVKGAIYESLLERYAREAKGAGQYFTPRSAIRAAVQVIAPRASEDINDPAAGTGGFLIGAYEYILAQTHGGADLKREERRRLKSQTFSGGELVAETSRLALMNLALHGIEPEYFYLGDSLGPGSHTERRYEVVMTNPPYGGRLQRPPKRPEFVVESRSSELNFVMHVASTLRHDRGRAVMVVPDGVLFQRGEAQRVRETLLEDCDVYTILALPQSAFVPYTGVQTNLIFFRKPGPTEAVWMYDLRTGIPSRTKKARPLTFDLFEDFLEKQPGRVEGERSWVVKRETLAERDFILTPERYNPNQVARYEYVPPLWVAREIQEHHHRVAEAIKVLTELLEEKT